MAMSILIGIGLVSDIFDGIIARRLNISSQKLRRLDSLADQIFWILIAIACYLLSPIFFSDNINFIILLVLSELMIYAISYLKFRKEVATHAIASKIWTLVLAATLIELIYTSNSHLLFQICFYLGIVTRLEIIAILLLLKKWTADVPSVYHAILIRNNLPIKRNKLFNG